jgi:hypothetical protein
MDTPQKNGCVYQDRLYSDGSEIRSGIYRMVCKDGELQDLKEGIDESKPSLAYFYH